MSSSTLELRKRCVLGDYMELISFTLQVEVNITYEESTRMKPVITGLMHPSQTAMDLVCNADPSPCNVFLPIKR